MYIYTYRVCVCVCVCVCVVGAHYTLDCPIECQKRRTVYLSMGRGMSGSVSGFWLEGCICLRPQSNPRQLHTGTLKSGGPGDVT